MENKLEPCPFCGGAPELDSQQAYRALVDGKVGTRFVIYCTGCNADMGFCREDVESCNHEGAEQEIITTWNTRPAPSEADVKREALLAELDAQLDALGNEIIALREDLDVRADEERDRVVGWLSRFVADAPWSDEVIAASMFAQSIAANEHRSEP